MDKKEDSFQPNKHNVVLFHDLYAERLYGYYP